MMEKASEQNHHPQGFPEYLNYQCDRLIPVARMLLIFSVVYLLGFGLLDYFKYPEYFRMVLFFRLLAALPLMLLISFMGNPKKFPLVPKYFLLLGLLSFACFLALNLSIPEKKDIVILVPIFYILVVIAVAPLLNILNLLLTFLMGVVIYYAASVWYIPDNDYIKTVFPHMTAIVLFTLITVVKIKQSAEENYHLAKNLHWRSQHDGLTEVFNRRGVFSWIKSQNLFAGKSFEPISLAMLDLDHFKQINDQYGHHVGDDVIKQSAQMLKQSLGEQSVVARFGGEEFLLVLQEGSEALNLELSHRLLNQFRLMSINKAQTPDLKVTVSIGFVNHRTRFSFEQSLKTADDCMYQAKQAGRDRLVAAKQ